MTLPLLHVETGEAQRERKAKGSVSAAKAAETCKASQPRRQRKRKAKGSVSAAKGKWKRKAKGSASAAKAAETQGKGSAVPHLSFASTSPCARTSAPWYASISSWYLIATRVDQCEAIENGYSNPGRKGTYISIVASISRARPCALAIISCSHNPR